MAMQKWYVLLLEILFVVMSFVFVGVIFGLRFAPSESWFQVMIRPRLLGSTFLRQVYGLSGVGDGRYAYADASEVDVVVAVAGGLDVDERVETYIREMIRDTVGAEANIAVFHDGSGKKESYSDDEVDVLVKELESSDAMIDLRIVYLSQSTERPTLVGEAINDRTILMYQKTLKSLSERPLILNRIEQSTLLHEWGHLLGLEHVARENCVMSAEVEVFGNNRYQHKNIPIDYCVESLLEIGKL